MAIITPKRRPVIARNTHVVDTARRTLDAVAPIIQQQNQNSLAVAGYPVFIYNRLTGGHSCTCSHANPTYASAPLYDDEGHAASSVIASIQHQAAFGIEEYNPELLSTNLSNELTAQPVTALADGALVFPEDETDLVTETSINAYNSGACNVCHGTGFKGGYHFMQGMRWTLDATDLVDSFDTEVDRTGAPYTMCMGYDGWVAFDIQMPKLGPKSPKPMVIIWNNFTPVAGVVTAETKGLPYRLGQATPPAYGYTRLMLWANTMVDVDQQVEFTHIEIQIPQILNPVMVDIPTLSLNFDASKLTKYNPSTIVLPPSVPLLKPWDVIADMQNAVHWLVTSARPVNSSNQMAWSQEVEARPVESHEQMQTLLLPRKGWVNYPTSRASVASQPISRIGGF